MVKLTLEFDTINEMRAFLDKRELAPSKTTQMEAEYAADAIEGNPAGTVATGDAPAPADKPKRVYKNGKPTGRPPRALPPIEAPTEPVAEAAVEPAEPVAPVTDVPAAPSAAAPTEADAKAALEAVFEKRGFQGAQQLLTTVGAQRLRDVPTEKYSALIAEAAKLAKGE